MAKPTYDYKVTHILADGTVLDSLEGFVITGGPCYEQLCRMAEAHAISELEKRKDVPA